MNKHETEQEEFWAGEFGNSYSERNIGCDLVAANMSLFAKILGRTYNVRSVVEFGPNIGLNLRSLWQLLVEPDLCGIEINPQAARALREWGKCEVMEGSLLDFEPERQWDVSLIKGVLIHINPERLPDVYDRLHAATRKYLCVVEYYNPVPVSVSYRGHEERLFKRDFAGEMLDRFTDLRLVDYGFCYHRDVNFPHDDLTWFLMEKQATRIKGSLTA